ncbi:hypothetical protein [Aquibacillus rhizosphaerae]|uniref:Uncharacterized protein n=1 Tax=Aquibacillus rhizosphaerae TaxID=3051431 RepID=A0ABT7L3N6_9BACI|nr:hypothetical protein [Aquibacillus sp. LR5S19]MDL4839812.1 hypothetical protein [Aquibacillus sp. LR5S19]
MKKYLSFSMIAIAFCLVLGSKTTVANEASHYSMDVFNDNGFFICVDPDEGDLT